MYESTVDVLYQLYDKLSIDGYVIMDDVSNVILVFMMKKVTMFDLLIFYLGQWKTFPSRRACEDFFAVSIQISVFLSLLPNLFSCL